MEKEKTVPLDSYNDTIRNFEKEISKLEWDLEKTQNMLLEASELDDVNLGDSDAGFVYESIQLQNKLLRKENRKLTVERNKAVRKLDSFKNKITKFIQS